MSACTRCGARPSRGICCVSHGAELCHRCYRVSHFVEWCVEGCPDCEREELPMALGMAQPKHRCEACGHDMPEYAVHSFIDEDGKTYYLCLDTESCLTRLGGMQHTGEASYLALAVGQLTKRVIALERWRQSEKDGGR